MSDIDRKTKIPLYSIFVALPFVASMAFAAFKTHEAAYTALDQSKVNNRQIRAIQRSLMRLELKAGTLPPGKTFEEIFDETE